MKFKTILLILTVALLAACQQPVEDRSGLVIIETTPVPGNAEATASPIPATDEPETIEPTETAVSTTPTPALPPTATPIPKHLNICIAAEPNTLYLYGDSTSDNTHPAFYDSLYTHNEYGYQAWGLEKMPDLADGDAIIGERRVDEGDRIINARGRITAFGHGAQLFNSGGDLVTFEGSSIQMNQMQVVFKLRPMVWSDGTPVTAADSLFSFNIAADPDSNVAKERVDKTAVYEQIDDHTIQWTGLPGWIDPTYFLNIWQPLPAHQLDRYSAGGLERAIEANRQPLANGAFMLDEWREGELLRFVKNPHYHRADEGLPRVTTVTFHITDTSTNTLSALQTGVCDIALDDNFVTTDLPDLLAMAEGGTITPHIVENLIFEQISLGVTPAGDYTKLHPNWFAQLEARQAAALCLDRQAMSDEILFGQGNVMDSYVPATYPMAESISAYPYDPVAANTLLDSLNYIDRDGDSIRENEDGDPFTININAPAESASRVRLAEMFAADLADCGINVTVIPLPAASFYTEGEEGPIFGRKFDAAVFAWLLPGEPACHLYMEKTREDVNVTGWSDGAFDNACKNGRQSFTNSDSYNAAHQEAMAIYADNLPSIPLFSRLRIAAITPRVQNFTLNSTQTAPLWNIAEIDLD